MTPEFDLEIYSLDCKPGDIVVDFVWTAPDKRGKWRSSTENVAYYRRVDRIEGDQVWFTSGTHIKGTPVRVLRRRDAGSPAVKADNRWNGTCKCGKGIYMGLNAVDHDGPCSLQLK